MLYNSRCRSHQRAPCKREWRVSSRTNVSAPLWFVLSQIGLCFSCYLFNMRKLAVALGCWRGRVLPSGRLCATSIQGVYLILLSEESVSQGGRKWHQAGVVQPQTPQDSSPELLSLWLCAGLWGTVSCWCNALGSFPSSFAYLSAAYGFTAIQQLPSR